MPKGKYQGEVKYEIGACIRRLREGKFTIEEAAGEADIGTSRLQRIETKDRILNQYLTDIEQVASALGTNLSDLIRKARVA